MMSGSAEIYYFPLQEARIFYGNFLHPDAEQKIPVPIVLVL